MAYSTQRSVSDGTLQLLMISIEFFDKSEISVYFDNIPTSAYVWATDKSLRFNSPVPQGVEVLIRRTTDLSEVRHVFSRGAQFKDSTLDDDFRQILHISQEAVEGANVGDIYSTLNMHGNKITNVGPATDDGDAVSLGQVKQESTSAWQAAAQAKNSENLAGQSAAAAGQSATAAGASAGAAASSAQVSTQQADRSKTEADRSAAQVGLATEQAGKAKTEADRSKVNADKTGNDVVLSDASRVAAQTAEAEAKNAAGQVKYGAVPLFTVTYWQGQRSQIPLGYIPADGQLIQRDLYIDVRDNLNLLMAPESDESWLALNTRRGKWSTGNGTTTFRVPDLNGKSVGTMGAMFLRGDGLMTDGIIGRIHQDQLQEHTHGIPLNGNSAANGYQAFKMTIPETAGNTNTTGGAGRFGAETRPMFATGVWIIKVFGAVVNEGSLDAMKLAEQIVLMQTQLSNAEAEWKSKYVEPAYMFARIGTEHLDPGPGVYVHWSVFDYSKDITYQGLGNRFFRIARAGLYKINMTFLSLGTDVTANMNYVPAAGGASQTLMTAFAARDRACMAAQRMVRLEAGANIGVFVANGKLYNPSPGGDRYGSITIERVAN